MIVSCMFDLKMPVFRYHDCFMVMSNAKDSEGELLRQFQHSALWYRRIIPDVQLLQQADYVVPDVSRIPGPLSKNIFLFIQYI